MFSAVFVVWQQNPVWPDANRPIVPAVSSVVQLIREALVEGGRWGVRSGPAEAAASAFGGVGRETGGRRCSHCANTRSSVVTSRRVSVACCQRWTDILQCWDRCTGCCWQSRCVSSSRKMTVWLMPMAKSGVSYRHWAVPGSLAPPEGRM